MSHALPTPDPGPPPAPQPPVLALDPQTFHTCIRHVGADATHLLMTLATYPGADHGRIQARQRDIAAAASGHQRGWNAKKVSALSTRLAAAGYLHYTPGRGRAGDDTTAHSTWQLTCPRLFGDHLPTPDAGTSAGSIHPRPAHFPTPDPSPATVTGGQFVPTGVPEGHFSPTDTSTIYDMHAFRKGKTSHPCMSTSIDESTVPTTEGTSHPSPAPPPNNAPVPMVVGHRRVPADVHAAVCAELATLQWFGAETFLRRHDQHLLVGWLQYRREHAPQLGGAFIRSKFQHPSGRAESPLGYDPTATVTVRDGFAVLIPTSAEALPNTVADTGITATPPAGSFETTGNTPTAPSPASTAELMETLTDLPPDAHAAAREEINTHLAEHLHGRDLNSEERSHLWRSIAQRVLTQYGYWPRP